MTPRRLEHTINHDACLPDSYGDPLDLPAAVDAVLAITSGPAAAG
jgi:hypothetical protein